MKEGNNGKTIERRKRFRTKRDKGSKKRRLDRELSLERKKRGRGGKRRRGIKDGRGRKRETERADEEY